MPIHTENNNKKTEVTKASLGNLLKELNRRRQIATDIEPYMYDGDVLGPYACVGDLESLNKGINTLINLNAQFQSLDDFVSVKKLREAELFFLKNTVLKNFKFPSYQSQVKPTFLAYADIEIQLDVFDRKALNLLYRGYQSAGEEASWIVFNLRNLNQWFFIEKRIDYEDYKSKALEIITQSRPILEQHRGYKKLLGNLVLLILTLGTAFIVNKADNGHFLFFQKTDSAEQLDKLNHAVFQLSA